ncbi:MAG: FHA domain-containing protein [Elusimicrobiota bacterium]
MMFLVVRDKAEVIKEYYVKKKNISIGSDEISDICIVHKMISPKHCEILQLDNGKIRVTDIKSTFGVFVNKKRVNSADIIFGDTVSIGPFELDFAPADKNLLKKNDRYCLLCVSGNLRGKKYLLLKDSTKIGRDQSLNDIVISELEDTLASRRHATIAKTQKGFILSDKRSKNRTKLNKEILEEEEEAVLKLNDEIVIGKEVFRLVLLNETNIRPPRKDLPYLDENRKIRNRTLLDAYLLRRRLFPGLQRVYQRKNSNSIAQGNHSQAGQEFPVPV